MAEQLTQAQAVAYNKKLEAAKAKAAQDQARKEMAEKEFERNCEELSEMLGKTINAENFEAEYAAFIKSETQKIENGYKILEGLEKEQAEAVQTASKASPFDDDAGGEDDDTEPDTVTPAPKAEAKPAAGDIDLDDLLGM